MHPQIATDARRYTIVAAGLVPHSAGSSDKYLRTLGITVVPVRQGFGLSAGLSRLRCMLDHDVVVPPAEPARRALNHGGHPVAAWNAESAWARCNALGGQVRLVPSDRTGSGRVDGITALATALTAELFAAEAGEGSGRPP